MEEILDYLKEEEREYAKGIYLLSKFGKNRQLAANLAKKESASNKLKLEYELKKLGSQAIVFLAPGDSGIAAAVARAATGVGTTVVLATTVQKDAILEGLKNSLTEGQLKSEVLNIPVPGAKDRHEQLLADQTRLFTERCKLSNTLADQETDEQRLQVATQIDTLQKAYNALAVQRKHYEEHGSFPAEEVKQPAADEAKPLDTAELIKKRGNLRSQVSKAKAAVEKKPTDVMKQEKLAKLQVELTNVELQLKQATVMEGNDE